MKSSLFLALSLSAMLGAATLRDDAYLMSNGQACPLDGTAKKEDLKVLNRDKSRSEAPTADDIDPDVTLAAMLAPGEDETRFDQKRAASVVGFVVNVKVGGVETCNCKATTPIDRDTHIELALAPDAPENQRVIVEVTPRIRLQVKNKFRDDEPKTWTTLALQSHGTSGIKGKWVEVTGWMLFDAEHTDAAENSSPGNPKNWRATCWEIHPVTDIRILDGPPQNTPALAPNTLRLMHAAHTQQVGRDKARRDFIAARNKANREKYAEDEADDAPAK